MFSNISITRECRKNLINLKGRRYNEVTDLSEDELARYLKIDNDLFKFYTNWYVFDDGLYYFKSDFVFNEIFLSELAREFNVKCVKFMLATDGHHIGVLSKNFRKKTSTYLDYLEFTRRYFAYIPEDLDTFKNQSYGVFGEDIGKRLTDQVFSLVAFDFFSGQNDRTHINVAFETNGSEVAKNVSQFVLLDSKIDNLPLILKEGRRSINNIERSSSLLLSKTIFTILLILVCIFMSTEYFFIPIHLTLITMFTIGIPSFILALEPNTELVKGNFLLKVFLKSIPSAITVVFNVIIINLFEINFNLSPELCSTLTVFLTATTGFIFLNNICKPYNYLRGALMIFLTLAFSYCAIFQNSFFNIGLVRKDTILVFVVLFICSMYIFDKLKMLTTNILKKTNNI